MELSYYPGTLILILTQENEFMYVCMCLLLCTYLCVTGSVGAHVKARGQVVSFLISHFFRQSLTEHGVH